MLPLGPILPTPLFTELCRSDMQSARLIMNLLRRSANLWPTESFYVETKVDHDNAEYRQSKLFHLDHPVDVIKPRMSLPEEKLSSQKDTTRVTTRVEPQRNSPQKLNAIWKQNRACQEKVQDVLNHSQNCRMAVVTTSPAPQESVNASKVISWLILFTSF